MSKDRTRIRKEELTEYTEMRTEIKELSRTIGMVELTKATYVANLAALNERYNKFIKKMEGKYGKDININLETGEITRKDAE